jgi:hypothetical protein
MHFCDYSNSPTATNLGELKNARGVAGESRMELSLQKKIFTHYQSKI